MKLLTKKEFLKLQDGTVYFEKVKPIDECYPCYFGSLCIKGESIGDVDFVSTDLNSPNLSPICHEDDYESFERMDRGENLKIDFRYAGRDGMYDDTDMYYVLDKEDVKSLLDVITEAYNSYM